MIKNLITKKFSPTHIAKKIKTLDMTSETKQLISQLIDKPEFSRKSFRRATIMNIANAHTGTLVLHQTSIGNISIKSATFDASSSPLYSVPGQSILFALDRPFEIQRYTLNEHRIEKADRVIIDKKNPLIIDGRHTLFDYIQTCPKPAKLTGRINLPNRAADINVFDRITLRKIAWLPHDESAARYLTSLELLETIQDPEAVKVAEELIYHYHPAVVWKAFQILYEADRHKALAHVALLKKHKSARLDSLLHPLEAAA
ncbi:hypothetical protein [Pseudomonas sp. SWRI154]|uniref:hypothetical protein n=1 Tax=Pseudomonas sp. SWRI154 TaxID=2745501 RepID=UPI0016496FC7|nr:hypothetical protein [Pseudomonas sp. SWRI154]MBC3361941.1 hypothetical protein [Pseudomonas sp. SWRI154]